MFIEEWMQWVLCKVSDAIRSYIYSVFIYAERQKKRPQGKGQYFSKVKGHVFILSI